MGRLQQWTELEILMIFSTAQFFICTKIEHLPSHPTTENKNASDAVTHA